MEKSDDVMTPYLAARKRWPGHGMDGGSAGFAVTVHGGAVARAVSTLRDRHWGRGLRGFARSGRNGRRRIPLPMNCALGGFFANALNGF